MTQTPVADSQSSSPIRVFLIDPEMVVLAGLRILIDSWQSCRVVGEAGVAPQAMASIEAVEPDLVILSHNGHSIESLDGLKDLTKGASAPVVLLTNSRDPEVCKVAARAGVKGTVLTREAPRALRAAIEKACLLRGARTDRQPTTV